MITEKIEGMDCPKCKRLEVYEEREDRMGCVMEPTFIIKHYKTYCRNCGYIFPELEEENGN